MATIAPMGLVNVVQSFPAHLVLNILHKFLIHFMSCVSRSFYNLGTLLF